jgi:dolichol-phosphate mannosyltransferase
VTDRPSAPASRGGIRAAPGEHRDPGPVPSVAPGSGLGRVLVIIPTYNEVGNLDRVVGRLRSAFPAAEVLVVDDASPDGTGRLADSLAAADPRLQVLHRTAKAGLGAAYLAGFRWGLARGVDVLVEMDADGSHAPEELPRLLDRLQSADLVIGSRWVPGGRVVNWSWPRVLLSRGGNAYTRLALGMPVRDATGGYRAFRRTALETLDLDAVASAGYCFQVDLAWRAVRAGLRVAEVPITFTEREFGTSKMSGDIVREALWMVTRWGVGHRARQLMRRAGGRAAGCRPRPVPERR